MAKYYGERDTYELSERLGAGGNGEVWRARASDGDVAVKLLKAARKAPSDAGPRFVREITALEKLGKMDGVLPLLDVPKDQAGAAQQWFVMPVATPLRRHLPSDAPLKDICGVCADLAAALGRVHERGIAHRDIKPDNLYWYEGHWCLGDFGLADFPDATELTESGKKLGPAFYIAPEMLNDAAHADGMRADVYSLGKTLWVLATGQTYPMPGVHDPTYAAGAIATYRNDPRSALLDELVRRMTLLDPTQRPIAMDIAHELGILAKDAIVETSPDPQSSFKRLRTALARHYTREEEEARQSALMAITVDSVKQVIYDIVKDIETQTGLASEYWYEVPTYWGYQAHLGGPRIESSDSVGYSFEAGGSTTWRLSIGLKHQMLSEGTLVLHVGYHLDNFMHGHNVNTMGMPRAWEGKGHAPNGTPSANELAANLISGLRQNLPNELDRYAQLVEQASK